MTHSSGLINVALSDDAVDATISNPNSQVSSLAETNSSQRSQMRPSSAGPLRPFLPALDRDPITPSTSLSNYSSQENVVTDRKNADDSQITQEDEPPLHVDHTAHTEIGRNEQAVGQKRTAKGQIKSPSSGSLPTSPLGSSTFGHSRNTSTTSRSSRIGEMSDKLQARMSYAKIKLQHGWEKHTISELEHMTSNQASPISASSYTARETSPADCSPVEQLVILRDPRRTFTNTTPETTYAALPRQTTAHSSGASYNDLTASGTAVMPINKPHETYEQFWQSHSNSTLPAMRGPNAQSLGGRSLAPPVEFSPRNNTPKQKAPLSNSDQHLLGRSPSTPPPRGGALAKLRTPSQQAAVEQDALEGLLSMNSPANSQSHVTAKTMPRSPFQGKVAGPSMVLNGIMNGTSVPFVRPTQRCHAPKGLNDDEINKMLDEMPESSSSDEDELPDRGIAPGKVLGS